MGLRGATGREMSLGATRAIATGIAIADLAGTVLQVTGYFTHAESAIMLLEIALVLHGLHAFTWFGAMLAASGGPGYRFTQIIFVTYIGAAFADFASVVVRLFVSAPWSLFVSISFWTAVGLVAVDLIAATFLWLTRRGMAREKRLVGDEREGDTIRTSVLPWLWIVELILVALIVFTWAAGLNRSAAFARVIVLETPHVFVWLLHRAVTGGLVTDDGIREVGWIWAALAVTTSTMMLSGAASIARFYYMVSDADGPPGLLPVLHDVYGWIQFGLGTALFLVALAQFFGLGGLLSTAPKRVELAESLALR